MLKLNLTLLTALLLAAVWLAACAPAAAPTAVPTATTAAPTPPPTAAVATVAPTAVVVATTATEPPTASASTGATVYQIVPGESSAQYEVGETFFGEGNRFAIAVGETTAITGTLTVDLQNPQNSQLGPIVADISQLKSDAARRDQALRERFLLTGVSPLATFTPTAISGLPTSYTPGETLTFQIVGDLTVGQFGTRPVTFDVTAQADGATLTGTAVTNFLMSDFGFGPIEIAGILGTEDAVKLTLKLTARAP